MKELIPLKEEMGGGFDDTLLSKLSKHKLYLNHIDLVSPIWFSVAHNIRDFIRTNLYNDNNEINHWQIIDTNNTNNTNE